MAKALQAGTSHFLGQNFAKAFDVQFTNKEGQLEHVWGTSWGVSTRLMGALVMAHSDDEGLVLPPKLAPIQVVIVPIYKAGQLEELTERIRPMQQGLLERGISVKFDDRDTERPGFKFAEWELKGVPVRIAVGMRDLESGTVEVARRDTKEKMNLPLAGIVDEVANLLDAIQTNIYQKALSYREAHTTRVDTYEEFKQALEGEGASWWPTGMAPPKPRSASRKKPKLPFAALPGRADEAGVDMLTGQPSAAACTSPGRIKQ